MELFSSYLKEIYGRNVYYFENNGFISYKITDATCYISTFYVKEEERRNSRNYYNEFISKLPVNVNLLSAKLDVNNPLCNELLMLYMRNGFKIACNQGDFIIVYKDLKCLK